MPIRSETNLYPGINPHLNSALQQRGGDWRGFHNAHINHIWEALEVVLPRSYYAKSEDSLQISVYDPETRSLIDEPTTTVADVSIYGQSSQPATQGLASSTEILTMPVLETLTEEEYIAGLMVYVEDSSGVRPVARIELLSPANKPPGSHFGLYSANRAKTLAGGLRLVEIDYLHERRPVIARLASYADGDSGAYPYHIAVNDPRPNLREGETKIYNFGILDTIPVIDIPLEAADVIQLDLGAVYQRTFTAVRLFREILTDYAQEPVHFERYSPLDRERIRQHMTAIAQQHGD